MQFLEAKSQRKFGKLLLIILTIAMIGCSSSNYADFQDKVVASIANDKKIDEKEYRDLAKFVLETKEPWAAGIKTSQGKIDDQILRDVLIRNANQKNIALSEAAIWQPVSLSKTSKFNVDIMLENSASMDGYVKGNTEFEATILALMSKLKNASFINSVNYGFVSVENFQTQSLNDMDDIKKFTDSLEPSLLQSQSGDRSASDIAKLISNALKSPTLDKHGVVVLVSDFIFSPPKGQQNAQDYLSSQGAYLEGIIRQKIKANPDFSLLVVKLVSSFNGAYYDKNGGVHNLAAPRPYYIWLMGDKDSILSIENELNLHSLNQYQNQLLLVNHADQGQIKYGVLTSSLIGATPQASFNIEEALKNNRITEAKVIAGQKLTFNLDIAVQLPQIGKNDSEVMFKDIHNYKVNDPNFVISKVQQADSMAKQRLASATHVLTLSYIGKQPQLTKTNLQISYQPRFPEWIQKSATVDDTKITTATALATGTFGIDTLLQSAYQAFNSEQKPTAYFDILIEP